jgi:hypothetical protein
MSREFTFGGGGLTIANAALSLAFLNPAAAPNFNISFLRIWCSQQGSATSAQQRVEVTEQPTGFPTLTSATPRAFKRMDPNASIIAGGTAGAAGTCGINASAEGSGTKVVIWDDVFNVINGYLWVATPREVLTYPAGSTKGVSLFLPAAAPSLTNWAVGMNYGEE